MTNERKVTSRSMRSSVAPSSGCRSIFTTGDVKFYSSTFVVFLTTSRQVMSDDEQVKCSSFAIDDVVLKYSLTVKGTSRSLDRTLQVPDLEDDGFFPHKLHQFYPRRGSKPMSKQKEKEALDMGLFIRRGPWNKREIAQLKENMEMILNQPHISMHYSNEMEKTMVSLILLGFFAKYAKEGPPDKKTEDEKYRFLCSLKRRDILTTKDMRECFLFDLGYKLPRRLLNSIYFVARSQIHALKFDEDIDDKEREEILQEKLTLPATKATAIAFNHLVRPKTVQSLISLNVTHDGQRARREPLSTLEKQKLLRLVMQRVHVDDVSNLTYAHVRNHKVNWTDIAKEFHLRTRWLCWRTFYDMSKVGFDDPEYKYLVDSDDKTILKNDAKIIYFMQRQGEEKEKNIDWHSLRDKMPDIRLGLILKSWERLKERVPKNVSLKGHSEVVKWLSDHVLQEYIDKNEKRQRKLERFYSKSSISASK